MKQVKILGTGCANCKATVKVVEEVAQKKGVDITLEKVEDIQKIMTYKVMATPAVVIDDRVVHAGGVPSRDKVAGWF